MEHCQTVPGSHRPAPRTGGIPPALLSLLAGAVAILSLAGAGYAFLAADRQVVAARAAQQASAAQAEDATAHQQATAQALQQAQAALTAEQQRSAVAEQQRKKLELDLQASAGRESQLDSTLANARTEAQQAAENATKAEAAAAAAEARLHAAELALAEAGKSEAALKKKLAEVPAPSPTSGAAPQPPDQQALAQAKAEAEQARAAEKKAEDRATQLQGKYDAAEKTVHEQEAQIKRLEQELHAHQAPTKKK